MVNVGYEVSYDQAIPGDIVLYDGHVGLYMGDGNYRKCNERSRWYRNLQRNLYCTLL